MEIANFKDIEILARFSNGKIVENKEEERILEEYRKIGWVKTGIKAKKIGNIVKVTPTAVLTLLGKQFVARAMILRSPWKKYLYKLVNLPA